MSCENFHFNFGVAFPDIGQRQSEFFTEWLFSICLNIALLIFSSMIISGKRFKCS